MFRRVLAFLVCLGVATPAVQARSVGPAFYDNLSELHYVYSNIQSHYISSYDRTGGNDDGFRGTYSQLYVDDEGEHVIFEEDGPGCVYNLWFTGRGRSLHWGKIKFYFDGEKTPRIESGAEEFFSGLGQPFAFPLVTHSFISSGGFSCSAPIPFAKHLKITTEKTAGFYNAYYQLYKNVSLESWTTQQDYSRLFNLFERCGSAPKPAAERTHTVIKNLSIKAATQGSQPETELFSLNQGGTIRYIKVNPLYAPDAYSLNHIFLRIFYDGRKEPSVKVPIGSFFGPGLGEADVGSLFVGMSSSGVYYCYLPMPFKKAVRITFINRNFESGADFFCEVSYTKALPKVQEGAAVGYLGAKYNKAWPIVERDDYVLFDYQGSDAVVGQVMTVEPVTRLVYSGAFKTLFSVERRFT